MNLQETIALVQALRLNGAKHFKSSDLEVHFNENSEPDILTMKSSNTISKDATQDLTQNPNYNAASTKQAEDLMDLLKMKDEELVNRIFPAGS